MRDAETSSGGKGHPSIFGTRSSCCLCLRCARGRGRESRVREVGPSPRTRGPDSSRYTIYGDIPQRTSPLRVHDLVPMQVYPLTCEICSHTYVPAPLYSHPSPYSSTVHPIARNNRHTKGYHHRTAQQVPGRSVGRSVGYPVDPSISRVAVCFRCHQW